MSDGSSLLKMSGTMALYDLTGVMVKEPKLNSARIFKFNSDSLICPHDGVANIKPKDKERRN